jgi:hypothetical protein
VRVLLIALFFVLAPTLTHAWNALGHKLVMEIASDYLTAHAKENFTRINQAVDHNVKYDSLVSASIWLDDLQGQDVNWFKMLHYCDIPFSKDESPLPPVTSINGVWAINQAIQTLLSNKSSDFNKGMALRILIHVVADIHQPLHSATLVSKKYPHGDLGGNRFDLGPNEVADNLHGFWDKGGGVLSKHYNSKQYRDLVADIETKWPCKEPQASEKPIDWAEQAHALAVNIAYQLEPGEIPLKYYQENAVLLSLEQISLASCRLAFLLNDIDVKLLQKKSTSFQNKATKTHAMRRHHHKKDEALYADCF